MMKLVALPVRALAPLLFGRDCRRLDQSVHSAYRAYRYGPHYIPSIMEKLLISGEDHRFFSHGGFDPVAIARAVWRNIAGGRREGASTIEQQIVRVLTGNYERSLRRKAKEIFLSTILQDIIPKAALPGLYLSIAYYGWRMNGLHQACKRLSIDMQGLHLAEASALVARLKYPEPKFAPKSRTAQIHMRANHLITLFHKHSLKSIYAGLENSAAFYDLPAGARIQSRISPAI